MIICGLIGALTQTRYRWDYWTLGMIALFYVTYILLWDGRKSVNVLGGWAKKTHYTCGVLTIGLWFLYPIAWSVSEGGNAIHPDSEAIFYGILDGLAKPVFSFALLYGHRSIDFSTLGLNISPLGHPYIRDPEKRDPRNGVDGGENHHLHNGANAAAAPADTGVLPATTAPAPAHG